MKKRKLENWENEHEVVELFQTEYELLNKFYQKYVEISPHILSGWNSEFFDIPYLYNRSVNVLGKSVADMLSPIRNVMYSEYKKKHNNKRGRETPKPNPKNKNDTPSDQPPGREETKKTSVQEMHGKRFR